MQVCLHVIIFDYWNVSIFKCKVQIHKHLRSKMYMQYTVKEANPDSLSTMRSTKRVRISLSHCVVVILPNWSVQCSTGIYPRSAKKLTGALAERSLTD